MATAQEYADIYETDDTLTVVTEMSTAAGLISLIPSRTLSSVSAGGAASSSRWVSARIRNSFWRKYFI